MKKIEAYKNLIINYNNRKQFEQERKNEFV
jgi:hypothetical protein